MATRKEIKHIANPMFDQKGVYAVDQSFQTDKLSLINSMGATPVTHTGTIQFKFTFINQEFTDLSNSFIKLGLQLSMTNTATLTPNLQLVICKSIFTNVTLVQWSAS
jgi:hypothetical protein